MKNKDCCVFRNVNMNNYLENAEQQSKKDCSINHCEVLFGKSLWNEKIQIGKP